MERRATIEELLSESGWLRALAAHLVADASRADDLVQETWLAALRRPPEEGTPRRPWLARVLRNRASNQRRGEERRDSHERAARSEREPVAPAHAAEEAEAQQLLAEEIVKLPEELRTVVVLRYFRGLDSSAIARELGVPAGTVRWRLTKALDQLRAALDRRSGGERNAWATVLGRIAARGEAASIAALGSGAFLALAGLGIVALTVVGFVGWKYLQRPPAPTIARADGSASSAAREIAENSPLASPVQVTPREPTETHASSTPPPEAGLEISGVVLVNGAIPTRPLTLELSRSIHGQAVALGTPTSSPPRPPKVPPLTIRPEDQGTFRFTGLEPGFEGSLHATTFVGVLRNERFPVTAPATGLLLDLVATPSLRGSLHAPDGSPVRAGEALVSLEVGDPTQPDRDGYMLSFEFFVIGEDGTFEHPLRDFDPDSRANAVLLFELEQGFLTVTPPPFDPWIGLDLGELRLEPVREVHVRLVDLEGAPVAGALVRVGGPIRTSRASDATDADGWTTISFAPARAFELRLDALGYRSTVHAVALEDELELILERAPFLEVSVVGADEPETSLWILGPSELFGPHAHEHFASEQDIQIDLGASQYSRHDEEGRQYPLPSHGRLRVAGLEPAIPFALELRNSNGEALLARASVLAPGEWQTLELDLGN